MKTREAMVRGTGIEPVTPSVSRRCSTTEPTAPWSVHLNRHGDIPQDDFCGPRTRLDWAIARVAHATRYAAAAFHERDCGVAASVSERGPIEAVITSD